VVQALRLRDENLRVRGNERDELAHYAQRTVEHRVQLPESAGSELMGNRQRTDSTQAANPKVEADKSLTYFDEDEGARRPVVVEPAAGVDPSAPGLHGRCYREEEVARREAGRAPVHPELRL